LTNCAAGRACKPSAGPTVVLLSAIALPPARVLDTPGTVAATN
jgi:hypothetical protein